MGIEYHFDKNDGLIAKIFAALGMMFTQGIKDQENNVGMAKTQEMSENRPETGGVTGVTESKPDITSKTIEGNGIKKDELDKVAQQTNTPQQNAPIKDAATPAYDYTL